MSEILTGELMSLTLAAAVHRCCESHERRKWGLAGHRPARVLLHRNALSSAGNHLPCRTLSRRLGALLPSSIMQRDGRAVAQRHEWHLRPMRMSHRSQQDTPHTPHHQRLRADRALATPTSTHAPPPRLYATLRQHAPSDHFFHFCFDSATPFCSRMACCSAMVSPPISPSLA